MTYPRNISGKRYTPLHLAAMHDEPEIIAELIAAGCEPQPRDIDGNF